MFTLSEKSLSKLEGVNQLLVDVVKLAIQFSRIDFTVTEGLRSKERQVQLVAEGRSRTLNSKHITGKAVDLAAIVDGKISWKFEHYIEIAIAMKKAAKMLGVEVTWGAVWDMPINEVIDLRTEPAKYAKRFSKASNRSPLVDGPHFELK